MSYLPLHEDDSDLVPLIRSAESNELSILVEYIHKDYNQDLFLVPSFKSQNPRAEENIYEGDHKIYADEIAAELQRYGGNTIVNLFRGGKGVYYIEILRDVADHLKLSYSKNDTAQFIEFQIYLKIISDAYTKMSEKERKDFLDELGLSGIGIPSSLPIMAIQTSIKISGFLAYKLSVIVANSVAKFLIGRGLSFTVNTSITKTLGAFAGPIGWAITAIWTVIDLAGPAYRVTIPCVLHVAYMRQKSLIKFCPNCNEGNSISSKFCNSCGASF